MNVDNPIDTTQRTVSTPNSHAPGNIGGAVKFAHVWQQECNENLYNELGNELGNIIRYIGGGHTFVYTPGIDLSVMVRFAVAQ